jgi:pimeloyl-ACP methyl ester carboxylesterase
VIHAAEPAPVVAIHGGLGLDHTYLRALDTAGGRMIYVDLEGHGRQARPADLTHLSMDAWADGVDSVRARLGLDRWTVLGHSYGGFIALHYALRNPRRVARLVLVCTGPSFAHAAGVVDRAGPDFAAALATPIDTDEQYAALWQKLLPRYFHRFEPRHAQAFASTRYSAAGYTQGASQLASYDLTAHLARISAPTLVISGDDDFIMPPAVAGAVLAAGIPGARHEVIAGSGHFPFLEQPDAFFSVLRPWLRSES